MYHVFNLYNKKIAYYVSTKCGSRTICGWGNIMHDPTIYEKHPEMFEGSRREDYRYLRSILPDYDINQTQNAEVRLCVVRDPIERFVSAFTNRVLYHKKVRKEITISEYIKSMDLPENAELYSDINSHTRALVVLLEKDPAKFTHIFNIKQLSEVKVLFERISGIPLPDLHLQQSGDYKKPFLTDGEIQFIKSRYKEDYDIYGKWM